MGWVSWAERIGKSFEWCKGGFLLCFLIVVILEGVETRRHGRGGSEVLGVKSEGK